MVELVADKVAQLQNREAYDVVSATDTNAYKVFGIERPRL